MTTIQDLTVLQQKDHDRYGHCAGWSPNPCTACRDNADREPVAPLRRAVLHLGPGNENKFGAVEQYLPDNYTATLLDDYYGTVIIVGRDHLGWTLDEYVIPRLASGLYSAFEFEDPS